MFSDYDERCILDIRAKTGIGVKKVKEYYEANGGDIEKTLKDIKNKIDLGIIEVIGAQTSGIIYVNVSNASTNYGAAVRIFCWWKCCKQGVKYRS